MLEREIAVKLLLRLLLYNEVLVNGVGELVE